jgi:tRNA threonylcarbamoyladenosine biosynthesis protein TsaE
MEVQENLFSLADLKAISNDLLIQMNGYKVIAFSGELGSGKTTLISSLCGLLGVEDVVGSPTFSLVNEYAYLKDGKAKRIFHIDAYRIKDLDEAREAGIEECFDAEGYCFVEWPERIEKILPSQTLKVFLSHTDSGNRLIKIIK